MMTKERKQKILSFILPPLAYLLIRALHLSCKKVYHIPDDIPQENYIISFWHGEILMQPFLYKKLKKPKIAVMISEHFDGELIAKTISYFGFETIRGSSSKGATRVLIKALKKLEEGYEVAITPDGPRGPRFSVADGIVVMSQKSDKPIVVFRTKCSRSWSLKSWDRFEIPKPFSTIEHFALSPFFLKDMSIKEAKELVKTRMTSL